MVKIPDSLRPIAHLIKISNEYCSRDIVTYYWCLYRAVQEGMKLDKSSPDALNFLMSILSQLEEIKNNNSEIAALKQDELAQLHIKNQAQTLLNYAESQEKAENFNMKVVKLFYTSSYLFDVLNVFRDNDENLQSIIKYCKWRATYIHNCLKTGEKIVANNQIKPEQIKETLDFNLNKVDDNFKNHSSIEKIDFDNEKQNYNTNSCINSLNNLTFHQNIEDKQIFNDEINKKHEKNNDKNLSLLESNFTSLPQSEFSNNFFQPQTYPCSSKINSKNLQPEDFVEARKFTKYALSALDYDDVTSAIENMHKALAILQKN